MMKKPKWWILAVLPLAVSCSDFATAPTRVPAAFEMTPDSVLLSEGETVTFQYTVLDEDGEAYDALPGWASPLWTFTEDSIFRVDPTGTGEALGPGQTEATAQMAGLTAGAKILVNPASLRVQPGFVQITQATQRRSGDVPLIAGRDGLLRVLVRGDLPNFFTPPVRATFYQADTAMYTVTMEMADVGLPLALEQGDLDLTYNALIPGSVLQPGTGLVVEIDPEGEVPAGPESVLRVPTTGVRALDVVALPTFLMRLVPVTQSLNGLESTFSVDNAEERTRMIRDVFPIAGMDVDVRAPYTTGADMSTEAGWDDLIWEIRTLREDDGSARYYYGAFTRTAGTNILGYGFVGYPTAIGTDQSAGTIAHEVGHNLSLPHAPCGNPAGADTNYPYGGAFIGQWGYSLRYQALRAPDEYYDLMSYCDPAWISDYNYEKVVDWRVLTEVTPDPAAPAEDVLLVHAIIRDGGIRLSPAIPLHTSPVAFPGTGAYTLTGLDADGATLFTLRFDPDPIDHGGAIYSAAIPVTVARPDRLATLRVTGPEGAAERHRAPGGAPPTVVLEDGGGTGAVLRWDTASYPMAVIRDRATGQIVAMPRGGAFRVPDPGAVAVTLSDGVAGHAVEMRQR